jgi:predicted site-specific integrase-resolvase
MPSASPDAPKESVRNETGFLDEKQLLARLPISRRTLDNWKAKGLLPFIKTGRRCLYDWPSVHDALLRRQRGGQW